MILRLYPCDLADPCIANTVGMKIQLCSEINNAQTYYDLYTVDGRNCCHWAWDNWNVETKMGAQLQKVFCCGCGGVVINAYHSNGLLYCQCKWLKNTYHKMIMRSKYKMMEDDYDDYESPV